MKIAKIIALLLSLSALSLEAQVKEQRRGWSWFHSVKASPEIARNQINFWGPRMSEHALFLYLGLDNRKLKRQAWHLHKQFDRYLKRFAAKPTDRNIDNIIPLLGKLKTFKKRVLSTLKSGKWIGFNYPSFVEHMLLELNYFTDKLAAKKFTLEKELAFWNQERSGEAAVTAHLLDPAEDALVSKAQLFAKKLKEMPQEEITMMQELSLKLYKEFENFCKEGQEAQKSKNLKSIIHPLLVEHVIKEGQRAIDTINSFKVPVSHTAKK